MKISLLSLLVLVSCTNQKITKEDELLHKEALSYFSVIEEGPKQSPEQVVLGRKLYFETKLSANSTISCNSCHNLKTFGVDNQATSPGFDGTRGVRNSPTTLNAYKHKTQFWDGRAKDVEEQSLGPILNPIEHGLKNEKEVLAAINTTEYIDLFQKAFPKEQNSLSFKNIGRAIGAFERTLTTRSRFDQYLEGNINALNQTERNGLNTFMKVGCTSCHSGEILGGNSFQKLGLVKEYPTKDFGRFDVTKKGRDKFKFKVPGLRNIEKTHPYFHDGSVKTLDEAIVLMARHQLGKELSAQEITGMKAFLSSLTGLKSDY